MNLFDKMGYDEDVKQTLTIARYKLGLTNKSLIILHENTKANNVEFLQKVNDYIINECTSIQDANEYIQKNNTIDIPELN